LPPPSPGGIKNGTFETGNLSGWTLVGAGGAGIFAGHTGFYSGQVGSIFPSGASSIAQTFTVPAGKSLLTFWYEPNCPDVVQHDWASATLRDNSTNATTTLLQPTCTNNGVWVQISAAVVAGRSYTLTLSNRDDGVSGDPTYTYYDDVALS